jgi:hypothetical protein
MTSAGVPSWTSTIPTTNGGTGLTSFTSGGLVYASSTSALTTGSVFNITSGSAQNRLSITSTAIKFGQLFQVSESTLGSSATFGISADDSGVGATYGQAYLTLSSTNIASLITLSATDSSSTLYISPPHNGAATNGSIYSYLNDYDATIGIVEIVDDVTSPYVIFGADSAATYVKTRLDTSIMEIKATTFQINTSTPQAGKVLTCTSSDGTCEWQDNAGTDFILFNMGFI